MGRGRAKAKQTKVARRLKYSSPNMDLNALQQELAGTSHAHDDEVDDDFEYEEYEDYVDPYADEFDDEGDDADADRADEPAPRSADTGR